MFRKFGILAVLLLTLGIVFAQDADSLVKQFTEVTEKAAAATVLVTSAPEGSVHKTCGSGAVISADGFIITCSHVVPFKKGIEVTLSDGSVRKAKLLGQNFINDYALLKVEAKDLQHFEIGDSGSLKKGEPVMALGFPGGPNKENKPHIAFGKVVGLNRNLPVDGFQRYYVNSIKTDIKSRPGNSGGPLVTADGKLVGINGAIIVFVDRTYAIPSDAIKKALPVFKEGKDIAGTPMKNFSDILKELGDELTPEEMKKFYEEVRKSFENIKPDKIWEQYKKLFGSELAPDEIFKQLRELFDGSHKELEKMMEELLGKNGFGQMKKEIEKLFEEKKAIEELARQVEKWARELEKLFGEEGPEKKKEQPDSGGIDEQIDKMLEQLRKQLDGGKEGNGGIEDITKKVDRLLDELMGRKPEDRKESGEKKSPYMGLRLAVLPEALQLQLGLKHGLYVEKVENNSPAEKAGLKTGDIILKADGKNVSNFDDVAGALKGRKTGDAIKLTVLSNGKETELELKLGAK